MAGRWWPLGLAGIYSLLILLFFGGAAGGFDTLANVQALHLPLGGAGGVGSTIWPLTCSWAPLWRGA